ncbi:MAG TPA: shikimate dehydrogenase [Bacteroidales bacterium]|nr:shikimate dehydrogenase [Bacteroidales bacterium]HPR72412.1 shikimate dehydrogenase [Bacteroidales bacterium]
MRKYGLIGYPLGHSFSKKYFTEKFRRENISDCSYDNYPVESIDILPVILENDPEISGLNVTIPWKTDVLKYIDVKEACLNEIGAANVLKIRRKAGSIIVSGFNSDIYGIRESLLPFINEELKNALVLGTGGAAKAVIYVLKSLGLTVINVSRRRKTGILQYEDVDKEIIEKTSIIVNTTPLGMYPDISSLPAINYRLLNENHILFDLVYNPEMTLFLKQGKERGCKIITGLKMLYLQAERSWEIWNDPDI